MPPLTAKRPFGANANERNNTTLVGLELLESVLKG
jgi:hypothetical protein